MKTVTASSFALFLFACSHSAPQKTAPVDAANETPKEVEKVALPDPFASKEGCFLLYDLKTETYAKVIGQENCLRRLTACSTFKVPLALMAFDSGILKDENTKLKWDGKPKTLPAWNQDHTAATWMSNSVVWFSQRLTPKLGLKKIKKYLHAFHYGNEDFSSGLTTSWLTVAPFLSDREIGSLKITPYEQVEFMKAFWKETLPVSKHAFEMTKKITFLEESPNGYKMNGKTGSGFLELDESRRIGWFIAHVEGNGKEYIAVTSFTDITPPETRSYAGLEAKAITKKMLAAASLW